MNNRSRILKKKTKKIVKWDVVRCFCFAKKKTHIQQTSNFYLVDVYNLQFKELYYINKHSFWDLKTMIMGR